MTAEQLIQNLVESLTRYWLLVQFYLISGVEIIKKRVLDFVYTKLHANFVSGRCRWFHWIPLNAPQQVKWRHLVTLKETFKGKQSCESLNVLI